MLVACIWTGVAVAALSLSLAACGDGGADEPPFGRAATTPAPTAAASEQPSAEPSATAAKPRPRRDRAAATLLPRDAKAEFAKLESESGGKLGLAVAPLGDGEIEFVGSLATGHAWSTIKVPIVLAAIKAAGTVEDLQADAAAALQRSDNTAAERIFKRLGDLKAASAELEAWLREAGDEETKIFTGTPPAGLSTYGQTDWSAVESARFTRALARGCLADADDTEAILSLMREPVASQRWGAGGLGTDAAYKGGWGPEEDGGYLVRQIAVIGSGDKVWVASAIARPDDRGAGSFKAGRELVSGALIWASDHLRENALGSPAAC